MEQTGLFQDQFNPYQIRNMDFPFGGDLDGFGYLTVNPRNYQRTSVRQFADDRPLNWTSKYGSVTFSFLGEGFPQGGLNENGLAIQVTVIRNLFYYPTEQDQRATITEMDVIQYILDLASTINEVDILVRNLRMSMLSDVIDKVHGQVLNHHWGLCDANGDCALLEYLDQQFQLTYYSSTIPHMIDPLDSSEDPHGTYRFKFNINRWHSPYIVTNNDQKALEVEYQRLHHSNLPIPQNLVSRSSFSRYTNAKYFSLNPVVFHKEWSDQINKTYYGTNMDQYQMNMGINPQFLSRMFYFLDRTSLRSWNKWQTVFDLNGKKIWYRTKPSYRLRFLDLNDLNFSVQMPITCPLHNYPDQEFVELSESDFTLIKSEAIQDNFRVLSILLNQSQEWANEFSTIINETRRVNLGELEDWNYRNFEHAQTMPSNFDIYINWLAIIFQTEIIRRFGNFLRGDFLSLFSWF